MAGYVIHLAIAKKYLEKNDIKDREAFFKGVIMPDLLDKKTSHYGEVSSNPNLKEFLNSNSLDSDYNKGYFLHLVTDYLFYNKFLKRFSDDIYDDYNKLNEFLIQKYDIEIPDEIKQVVEFEDGEPVLLDKEKVCEFIEFVSNLEMTKEDQKETFLEEER